MRRIDCSLFYKVFNSMPTLKEFYPFRQIDFHGINQCSDGNVAIFCTVGFSYYLLPDGICKTPKNI